MLNHNQFLIKCFKKGVLQNIRSKQAKNKKKRSKQLIARDNVSEGIYIV